jgi:hypothetical protein
MKIYLEERIGHPGLFTGRKNDLDHLLKWVSQIKIKISKSKAIISRRKTGKSALMERLFNIVFEQNSQVVPFYIEIKETSKWIVEFAREFFFTFICQYIAFHSRNPEYLKHHYNYSKLINTAKKEGLDHLIAHIEDFELSDKKGYVDILWDIAREAPCVIAQHKDERILQMIDEFQFINRYIYRDKACKDRITNLAGSYLHTAERKNAPLLVSGSWVGWLIDDLNKMLPGRFILEDLTNMPKHEAIEMALNYSAITQIPINYETACIMAELTEGNPFYMSSLFQSPYEDKDFSTEKGILEVLDFETFDKRGSIRGTWMEYIASAIDMVNDVNGKKIILYICKKKEVTRADIQKELNLEVEDRELEKRLKAFVKADIIEQGTSNFNYQAVNDNIFDKVFRGVYQEEIDGFTPDKIKSEYRELYKKSMGKFNRYKGEFSEYVVINHLKHRAHKQNDLYVSMIRNLPEDFSFVEYDTIWSYTASPVHKKNIQIDVFARAREDEQYSLIGEVKNRKAKFSLKEAKQFFDKATQVKKMENINKTLFFVFSSGGFYKNTLEFLINNSVAISDDTRLFDI